MIKMPLPKPQKPDEDQASFIKRCMSDPEINRQFSSNDQRLAVCFSQWRRYDEMHIDFQRILINFVKRYGENEGAYRFFRFIQNNNLLVDKSYDPAVQFAESFNWIEPTLKLYTQDNLARYYKACVLTCNLSMNNND